MHEIDCYIGVGGGGAPYPVLAGNQLIYIIIAAVKL